MKIFVLIFCMAFGLLACNNNEVEDLKIENQQLRTVNSRSNVSINAHLETLNEIADNLRTIEIRENRVSNLITDESDWVLPIENQIFNNICSIEQLIEDNKIKIRTLEFALEDQGIEYGEVKNMLAHLKMDVIDRDNDIAQLLSVYQKLDSNYAILEANYDQKLMENMEQEMELNTAWFVLGNTKELTTELVIHKTGGVMGIAARKNLSPDFNANYYTQVDIRFFSGVPILSKKAEILSQHPEGSFRMISVDGKFIKRLEIIDPYAFWSVSKYLTLVVD